MSPAAKPFAVIRTVRVSEVIAHYQHLIETSPLDLSHLQAEIDRYLRTGSSETPLPGRYATREEAEAVAVLRNAARTRNPGITYRAEHYDSEF